VRWARLRVVKPSKKATVPSIKAALATPAFSAKPTATTPDNRENFFIIVTPRGPVRKTGFIDLAVYRPT
jgi:hypothetical protein